MASRNLDWQVALAGECMASRPFAMHDDPASMAVVDLLRNADMTYAHLEMNLADYGELAFAARGDWLGSFMMADPQVARDLTWAGIDIMSLAHNHSMDFGEPGEEFSFQMPGDQSTRGSNVFVAGDRFEIQSSCHTRDLEGNLRSIDEARKMADFVVIAHHFNIADGKRGDKTPMFVREFAHAAIDAGADIYVGHGWHSTLGIELYKGKPIVYAPR
ncbi:MAG: hypothetical protein GEV05_20370 [Betaproteobacteria bacterium]|nr:hypothetical protein [Betaproteobacteria bacterium]